MRLLRNSLVVLLLVMIRFSMPVCFAQKIAPPPDAATQVGKIFAQFNHTDSPGCSAGISIDDAIVLSAAYGMADLEHNIALTPDSVFEPGSVTKQFTATAVLLLAQDGKLSIDDPVRKYFPELPEYGATITIRNLLNHTSGLRDWGNIADIEGWPRGTRAHSNTNVLEIASRQKELNYPPGAAYSYTNTGFNLLALLVSRVSGKSLAEFTHERIFVPLGMNSTEWRDDFQRIVHNRAIAYTQSDGITRELMPFENAHGNGGLLTTVGDLLRWNANFTAMKVGGPALIQAQRQQGHLNDGRTIAYAAGLEVLTYKGVREISHSGATAGYRGWLARYPDQALSVAVLCNTGAANPVKMGHEIADLYLAGLLSKEAAQPAFVVDSTTLQSEAGMYRSDRDHDAISFELKDGHLQDESGTVLKPVAANAFRIGEAGPIVSFDFNPKDEVARMHIANDVDGGHDFERVAKASPSSADLQAMAGDYISEEAEVTLSVQIKGNGLEIHRRPDSVFPLKPTYADGFSSDLGSIRFLRDSAGKITEMSIGEDRVWDLRLRRVAR